MLTSGPMRAELLRATAVVNEEFHEIFHFLKNITLNVHAQHKHTVADIMSNFRSQAKGHNWVNNNMGSSESGSLSPQ